MRTFTQKELNEFIKRHIQDACEKYLLVKNDDDQSKADCYYAQIMAYHNMAIAFADTETFLYCCNICNKALEIEL